VRASEQTGRSSALPISDAELVDLRLRYETAYAAYQTSILALEEALRSGEKAVTELHERQKAALRELTDKRKCYRDALAQVAFLPDDSH
jgi:hypothetical protein